MRSMVFAKVRSWGSRVILDQRVRIASGVAGAMMLSGTYGHATGVTMESGATQFQTTIIAFAKPAAVIATIAGFLVGYFADDNSWSKKVGYTLMFLGVIGGAVSIVELFL